MAISGTHAPPGGSPVVGPDTGAGRDMLTFRVANEEYAIGIEHIRSIIKYREITPVPRVPAFIAGIIAVRGVIIPVLDLRLRLRLPAAPIESQTRILIVRQPEQPGGMDDEREQFGLIVDSVHNVVRVHHVEPPSVLTGNASSNSNSSFVAGIGRLRAEDEDKGKEKEKSRNKGKKVKDDELMEPRSAAQPHLLSRTSTSAALPRRILIILDLIRVLPGKSEISGGY